MKNRLHIPFLLLTILPGLLVSGQVKFTTVASGQEIGRSDYLKIEYVVENAKQIDQLEPPDFPGFTIVQGPMQSSGMTVINGNVSQSIGVSFVLQPEKTGKFTIQGATANVDGKKIRSNPVTITVTATSSGNSANNNNNLVPSNPFSQLGIPDPMAANPMDVDRENILRPGENVKEKISRNLFLKVQVDKTTCYVGEPIVATYKLYSRLNSEGRVTKRPSLNGFSVYDMVDPGTDVTSVEKLNGKPFMVHIIRKTQLIPLQAGSINLDPCEVENNVHFFKAAPRHTSRSSGDPFQDLFDRMNDNSAVGPEVIQNVTLDTKPVQITVKPLPEAGRPADFNGAVGNFSMQSDLPDRSVAAQDEASLRVTIKGSGNLPVMTAPQVQWPSGIEAFDPTAKEEINKTVVPMKGSKTFTYLFSPHAAGHYTLPAVSFSYFDPVAGIYKRVATNPIDLQVAPSSKKAKDQPRTVASGPEPSTARGIPDFIDRHLESIFAILILSAIALYLWRQNLRLRNTAQAPGRAPSPSAPPASASSAYATFSGSSASASAAAYSTAAEKAAALIPNPRSTMDPKPEADPLADARSRFDNGDYSGFYRDLNRAIWMGISANLNLPASELNKFNISRRLAAKGWDAENILSLEHVLNECEMNLYTPAYDPDNMQQLMKQAESLLRILVPHSTY
ncbi:MAG: BatD family protein [Bacteroidota bacterium]|nr:BatD family protein [Bacteroidota bacterium]MDP4215541.1 BatD family protein [Bacteroidota bacterium]MDP4245171.1 BatD family protein [Bacteroidota bacterium]MDP4253205.1 BatD family protein [Bacteroidota bacterium]MDP4258243.1 BatD family protein [Bacteroidota bacterium]